MSKNKIDKQHLIQKIENQFIQNSIFYQSFEIANKNLKIGDIIKIGYLIPEGDKERIQYYEGLLISKKNRGLGKSLTIRRNVQGIGIEQIFLTYSPKILSILKKQSSKVRRAKLYFVRKLTGKATRLKKII
jgi:large subunit ribosomal protein L19